MHYRVLIMFILLLAAMLCACEPSGLPHEVVAGYLQDMVSGDLVGAVNHACSAWEDAARTDAASFSGVEARIEGLSCQIHEDLQDLKLVLCRGKIVATYQGEDQEIQLADRIYRVEVESGEWRVCGTQ